MGASHSAFARLATPQPLISNNAPAFFSGKRYRLVKTNGIDYRVLWDGYDLKEIHHTLTASRHLHLPWWRDNFGRPGIKVMIRFEKSVSKQEDGKWVEKQEHGKMIKRWKEGEWIEQWIECEDPRFVDRP